MEVVHNIIVLVPANHFFISHKTEKEAKETAKKLYDLIHEVTRESDKTFCSHDSDGGIINFVKASQIVGFYYRRDFGPSPQEKIAEAVTKIAKEHTHGEDWKGE